MALMDMIKQSLEDAPAIRVAVESHQNETMHEDLATMEAIGVMDSEVVESHAINAMDALRAMESHIAMKAPIPTGRTPADIAAAIEESLPTEAPEYDPTKELDDIAQTLAGIDDDDDVDPDQPQPEEDLGPDDTIHNMMTEPKDTVNSDDPDANGVLNL